MSNPGPSLRGAVDLSGLVRRANTPPPAPGSTPAPSTGGLVVEISEATFPQIVELSSRIPVVVELYAPGLSPALGPIVESAMPEGSRVRIRFRDGTADGLHGVEPYPVQGFALSEDGQTFEWAQAQVEGSDVVVWNDQMSKPTLVRYAWSERSLWANLVNGEDMPAAPFEVEVGTFATTSTTTSSTSTTIESTTTSTSETSTTSTTSSTLLLDVQL